MIIPFSGQGAAIATTISEFFVTAVQLILIRTTISRKKLFKEVWKYFLAGVVMYVVVLRLNQMMHMNIFNLAIQVLVGAVLYFVILILIKAPIIKEAKRLLNKQKE